MALDPDHFLDPDAYRAGPLGFDAAERIGMSEREYPEFDPGPGAASDRLDRYLQWAMEATGAVGAVMTDAFGNVLAGVGHRSRAMEMMALRLTGQMERALRTDGDLGVWESEPGSPLHAEGDQEFVLALQPCRFRSARFGLGLALRSPLEEEASRELLRAWEQVLRVRA
ncbi:MAG TPA: hypothetical protein VMN36_09330 [Verrucomicrobiales bacterium]|nr:hypothetical protein [Verrucomicrobiales bacterium]